MWLLLGRAALAEHVVRISASSSNRNDRTVFVNWKEAHMTGIYPISNNMYRARRYDDDVLISLNEFISVSYICKCIKTS